MDLEDLVKGVPAECPEKRYGDVWLLDGGPLLLSAESPGGARAAQTSEFYSLVCDKNCDKFELVPLDCDGPI